MSLLTIIIALIAVGVVLYCINQFVPLDSKIKMILNVVVILVLVVWLLQAFGVFNAMETVSVPRVGHH